MDFYMSLWFYAMHALHYGAMPGTGFKVEEKDLGTLKENETTLVDDLTPHTNGVLLEFEEFHFYYTSVYPMFKRKLAADVAMGGAADADSRLNLSTEVLGQALIDGFPMDQYNEMTNPAQTLKSIMRPCSTNGIPIFSMYQLQFIAISIYLLERIPSQFKPSSTSPSPPTSWPCAMSERIYH